jgi:hypothetical protein
MSSRYKLLQSDQNYYAFKEKNNSYFDGLTWKKVKMDECSYILNNEIDVSVQAKRLGNILDYKYINESSNNNIVNLTQFQFTNNYDVKPFHEYGIGDPSFINYCVSGNTYFYKPNTNGIINSGKFHEPDTFIFEPSTTSVNPSTTPVNPYSECENKARRSNVPYFVVGDMNYSTTEASYNCYIPKFRNAYNTNIIKQLIDPISETINNIFHDAPNKITDRVSKYLIPDASQNNNYIFKNDAIPGTGNFLIYTEDIYNFSDVNPNSLGNIDEITREIQNVTSHKDYSDLYNGSLNPTNMYNHFYKYNTEDHLTNYFTNFNCLNLSYNTDFSVVKNNVALSDVPFNGKIKDIYNQWKQLNHQNNNIINDISRINIIGKGREAYLRELYKVIENQQNELKKLLNNSNGGIGRLKDQKYLRDNTILEINILILIIIFSLFLYSKIK